MPSLTGQCLCGDIHYEMTEAPLRVTLCSCHFCQRATGAAQAILPVFEEAALHVTRGAPSVHDHTSTGSGKVIHIHLCPKCGTKLWQTFERWPGFVGVFSGTLDNPDHITLSPDTAKQIFLSSARQGTVVLAGIPAFWNHATTLDGTPEKTYLVDTPTPVETIAFAER